MLFVFFLFLSILTFRFVSLLWRDLYSTMLFFLIVFVSVLLFFSVRGVGDGVDIDFNVYLA